MFKDDFCTLDCLGVVRFMYTVFQTHFTEKIHISFYNFYNDKE
jgi:hypothetical protein